MKDKICFVVQRYGLEVNGGAELHCREIAEHMGEQFHVTVLTSRAVDYMTWEDRYDAGEECINGVRVLRFSVEHPRDNARFNKLNGRLMGGRRIDEAEWVKEQGPFVPELTAYIREHKDEYRCFIFFTYLYYPTVEGIKEVKEKAILVPDAHDEVFLRMKTYKNLFRMPKGFFFNTEEERELVFKKFHLKNVPCFVGGIGIEVPKKADGGRFKEKYGLSQYILYAGRIDVGKNCHKLFACFDLYKKRNPGDLKLVLMGKEIINVPRREDIVSLGFVSEEDKYDGMAGAKLMVMPSRYESLSIVVLESMELGVPVLINGDCDVLKGHCKKSNGGLYYTGYYEFEGALNYMLTHEKERILMGKNGKKYVNDNYCWEKVTENLKNLINITK